MSINTTSDLKCALCMYPKDGENCEAHCPQTIADTGISDTRVDDQRRLLNQFKCDRIDSQECVQLQTQMTDYIFSPSLYKKSPISMSGYPYALVLLESKFNDLYDRNSEQVVEALSMVGDGVFALSQEYEIIIVNDKWLHEGTEYLLSQLLQDQQTVAINPSGVQRLSPSMAGTTPINRRLPVKRSGLDMTNRLLIVPCVDEISSRFEITSENQTGRMICKATKCRYTSMDCTVSSPRCLFNGRMEYTPRSAGTCNTLTHVEFWEHMISTLKWICENDVDTRKGPRVFIFTTHSKRLKKQIFPSDFKYMNGHTIHVNKDVVQTLYEGKGQTSRKFQAITRLQQVLPPDYHLFIVRHGEGYHNVIKHESQNRVTAGYTKVRRRADVLDAGLTRMGALDALSSATYIHDVLTKMTEVDISSLLPGQDPPRAPRITFLASSLLRSQQTTLHIYRMLRTSFIHPSPALDSLSNELIEDIDSKRYPTANLI